MSEQSTMDAAVMVQKFTDFITVNYLAELLENARKGFGFLNINFRDLITFEPELADLLLDQPEEVLKAAEIACGSINEKAKSTVVRVHNLPAKTCEMYIRNIRSKHLNKFFLIEGIVRQKSDVRPQVTSAKFECPSCGNVLAVIQVDKKFKEPTKCSCGRKGKFRILNKELVDAQMIKLEEIPEQLEGGAQPKRIDTFLTKDLVSPLTESRTNPGARIKVTGVIKEVPITLRTGGQATRFDLLFEVNHVEPVEQDLSDIKISESEEKQIIELSKHSQLWKKMVDSIAPSIYGHDMIKKALILQMLGGVQKQKKSGITIRGDIHMLLIGDPGGGKSQMLKRQSVVAPKARFVSGRGASGTGLTATVVKDEFLQGWSLEAGALVLANKGLCCIDELDKMTKEDTWSMHEAMEQQSVSISKANIQASLRCETTILAAANPKFGRFDPFDTVASQINLPSTLVNRFDLIFPIKDLPDKEKDARLAGFILGQHQSDEDEPPLETELLRKYIAYARQQCVPVLTDEAIEELQSYFVTMRGSGTKGGVVKSIPISARQLEGLVRLSEAAAKLRLSSCVTAEHAKQAIELLDYCLKQVALDEETGTIDIDRIATDMPASQRSKIITVKEIIVDIENKIGKVIPLEDIVTAAGEKGIQESEVEEVIQKLKRSGDLFEPKRGFISRI
ncbi:AAA domain-containing protein [Candidatus Woesearchaeota archaeon]|nr:AAA domain-containing protein [Candidatus Woesearchaeota archaeon]